MAEPSRSRRRRRWNRRMMGGAAIVAGLLLAALLAPWLAPHDPLAQDLDHRRQPPTAAHPFGLDELGRDNLSRVLYGARPSLRAGATAVLLAALAGGALGAVAGYRGGWPDSLVTSLAGALQAFPTLLLAMAVILVLGRGLSNVVYAVAIASLPGYFRLMRIAVLAAKGQEHVLAARAVGVSPARLLWRHILPGCLIPLQVQATLGIGTALLEAAGLSFLGLGAQPPAPEWGAMLGQGRGAILAAPHVVLFPGLALMVAVLGFSLLGDGWQDWARGG